MRSQIKAKQRVLPSFWQRAQVREKAGFKGEMEFRGRGVAYCATWRRRIFSQGKDVFVVGGGFAAAEEAIFLTRYAKKVKILVREPAFTCAGSIVDSVDAARKN